MFTPLCLTSLYVRRLLRKKLLVIAVKVDKNCAIIKLSVKFLRMNKHNRCTPNPMLPIKQKEMNLAGIIKPSLVSQSSNKYSQITKLSSLEIPEFLFLNT